jgi:bifunctional non-homologous end joining protein LigD
MPPRKLPIFAPMPLARRADPFDDRRWIFELKYDGYRALAHVFGRKPQLVSRNGRRYVGFDDLRDEIELELNADSAVLDGEIVCFDDRGRPQFADLVRRRGRPAFVAFDLLWLNGRDVRGLTLLRRKTLLRAIVPEGSRTIVYAHHVKGQGRPLFHAICQHDLEGIVAKLARGRYEPLAPTTWVKIKNPTYSQAERHHHLFERRATMALPFAPRLARSDNRDADAEEARPARSRG